MNVISLKEYARVKSISYEAVRQQVARYRDELGEHLIKDGRQQYLDEAAVAFLDERRQKNPVVIYQENKDEELERLRENYQATLEALSDARERIIAQQDKIYELRAADQKIMLLEATSKAAEERAALAIQGKLEVELALKDSEEQRAAAEQHAQAAEDVAEINAQEAARAKAEAEDLRAKLEQIAAARGFKRRKLLKELTGGKHG